jgi:hypothetical protein
VKRGIGPRSRGNINKTRPPASSPELHAPCDLVTVKDCTLLVLKPRINVNQQRKRKRRNTTHAWSHDLVPLALIFATHNSSVTLSSSHESHLTCLPTRYLTYNETPRIIASIIALHTGLRLPVTMRRLPKYRLLNVCIGIWKIQAQWHRPNMACSLKLEGPSAPGLPSRLRRRILRQPQLWRHGGAQKGEEAWY